MEQKQLLAYTIYVSIFLQIVTGAFTITGVFIDLPKEDIILHDVIFLETIVQVIEFGFYVLLSFFLIKISMSMVTPLRYLDWFITTPTMLISTIMFMEYKNRQKEKKEPTTATKFVKNNKENIIKIVLFNLLMLIFGIMGECGYMNIYLANIIGFVFFGLTFYTIYENYVLDEPTNKMLFTFMFSVWALYGVAALLPSLQKNISYNSLDIVAKNFYGLFIFYHIVQISKKAKKENKEVEEVGFSFTK
jgi:bacteriorhodopsin